MLWIVDPAQCLLDEKSIKEIMALLLSSHIIMHQIRVAANMKTELINISTVELFCSINERNYTFDILFTFIQYEHHIISNKNLL